ncbi:uncharacterized protein LOC141612840 [Silene latifolia]|uniref:uncharacterized protein LOC141612840 n=1 Tax=Silene latifolia TaxID=37657 RepID=UPI003D76BE35
MKRPKLTHHHHHRDNAYEFSCSNTPCHFNKRAHKSHARNKIYRDEEREFQAVNRVLDMMLNVSNNNSNARNEDVEGSLFTCSPVLPGFGFGRSPMVRELRVTDSPYLVQSYEDGEMCNYHVDEAAEEFIKKFYDQLQQQRITEA